MNKKLFITVFILILTAATTAGSNHKLLLQVEEQLNGKPRTSQVPQLRIVAADVLLHHHSVESLKAKVHEHMHPLFDALLVAEKNIFTDKLNKNAVTPADIQQLYPSSPVLSMLFDNESIIWKFLHEKPEQKREHDEAVIQELIKRNPSLMTSCGNASQGTAAPRHDPAFLFCIDYPHYHTLVPAFIATSVNPNSRNQFGSTAVMRAACRTKSTEVLQLLINAKADIHLYNHFGSTALDCAVFGQDLPTIILLLQQGGSLTTLNIQFRTPLEEAERILKHNRHPHLRNIYSHEEIRKKIQTSRAILAFLLAQLPLKDRLLHKLRYPHL